MTTIAARLYQTIDGLLAGLLAVVLAVLLVLVFGATLLRYVFSTGFVATEDLGILLHTALVFLGLPLCASGSLAMRIDVVTRRLGPTGRNLADGASDAITLAASLVLMHGAGKVAVLIGGKEPRSILFCREKNEEREVWDGFRFGPPAARDAFGFDEAYAFGDTGTTRVTSKRGKRARAMPRVNIQ